MAGARLTTRRRERLLIAGGGMAALRLVEDLVQLCPGRYDILLVTKEPRLPYNRVLLSSLLGGEAGEADLELKPAAWFAEHGVRVATGAEVTGLVPGRREIVLANGAAESYDRFVLATGSKALPVPVPGHDLPGAIAFRERADVAAMHNAPPGTPAVVIGGGLLGVEAACGLATRGIDVTLLHIMPRLMERQLDAHAASLLQAAVERKGVTVVLEAQTACIEGRGKVERVALQDGRSFAASLVVMAAGIKPETALARSAGLDVGRGIKVGDTLETSVPGIYALGECAEHRGTCYGVVEPLYEQAKVLAHHLADEAARYEGSILAASLKVSGVPVFSLSEFDANDAETIVLEDEAAGTYRKLVVRNNRLAGAVLFGDTADALWYRDLARNGTPIAPLRPSLAFGRALAEAA
jgi:nitrite reductase (NADH) large subunit